MKSALFLLAAAVLSAGEYSTYIGDQNAWSIAQVLTDASGNTYVAGSRTFNLSYDPLHPTPLSEAIVAKIDSSGKTVLFAGIGGKGSEAANAIAVDPAGNIYIGGVTTSPNFPLHNALYTAPARGFLVKYNPTASDVLWATYFPDVVSALAADSSGVYVTGTTTNSTFPTTPGLPAGATGFRSYGAYLTKLTAAGDRILYSTVISGGNKPCGCCSSCFTSERGAYAVGVGVDAAGNAYFGGNSDVVDLPTTPGVLAQTGAGAWVAKVNATGSALAYLTYLTAGGVTVSPHFSPATSMGGLAIDAAGHAFVAGSTFDPHLPVTQGAFQTVSHGPAELTSPGPTGPTDAFALELNATGTAVVWGSYLGGAAPEFATTAALDPSGNFWVAGNTRSTEFPNASGWSTGDDFIAEFNTTGGLTYSGRYPTGTVKTLAVDSSKLLHVGEPGGVLSAIVADPHPAVRPWFVGLYGGQIAPSEVISIYGPHLDGQPVTVNGTAAEILYTSDQQINLVVPAGIQGQTKAAIRVGSGPAFNVGVLPAIPQIFAVVNQDGTLNAINNPAAVGSIMSMWVTGFGAVNDPSSVYAGAVYANGQPVQELYSGAAPGLAVGVGQINFIAPNYWSIVLTAGGQASQPFPIFVR